MIASTTPGYGRITVPADRIQKGWVMDARNPDTMTVETVATTTDGKYRVIETIAALYEFPIIDGAVTGTLTLTVKAAA